MDQLLGSAEILILALALLFVAPVTLLALRRRWLSRKGGMFDCSLRLIPDSTPGAGWALGVARYEGESLQWFRSFSLALRPRLEFIRGDLRVGAQRNPEPAETVVLQGDQRVVEVVMRNRHWELSMSSDSLTGLLSWLEAAPPGTGYQPFS